MENQDLEGLLKTYMRYSAAKGIGDFIGSRVLPSKADRQQERINELQIKQMERSLNYPEDSFDLADSFRKKTGYPLGGVAAAGVAAIGTTRMLPRARTENLAPSRPRATMTRSNPFGKIITAAKTADAFSAFAGLKSGVKHVRPARLFGKLWR